MMRLLSVLALPSVIVSSLLFPSSSLSNPLNICSAVESEVVPPDGCPLDLSVITATLFLMVKTEAAEQNEAAAFRAE